MERATGERFDRLMRRLVLFLLKLDACFNWSGCSDAAIRRAVVLYDAGARATRDDLRGQRPACLVIAARDGSCDLARWTPGRTARCNSPQGGLRIRCATSPASAGCCSTTARSTACACFRLARCACSPARRGP